jgi:anti-anti-sigma factor
MRLKIVRTKNENGSVHLELTGEMTVYSSVKLKDIMVKEIKESSGLTMDLSGVDEADTSGFQLLLFLRREAGLLGKSFGITETSRRLGDIFALYKETI